MIDATLRTRQWIKQGLVYCPDGSIDWAKQYALLPIPLLIAENCLRIFLSFCDENMVGRVGYVDVDPDDPKKILKVSPQPILDIGKPGRFDENGLIPTCILPVGNKLFMYYVGYQFGQKVRYYQFSGLAISEDGGNSFHRAQEVSVIDRSHGEALNRTAPFVMLDNTVFRMWYVGGSEWTVVNGKTLPIYNMRHIESEDGIHWPSMVKYAWISKVRMNMLLGVLGYLEKMAFTRCFFLQNAVKGYRLGYAESKDGIDWRRHDHRMINIDVSDTGWDSQMLAYASIFRWKDTDLYVLQWQ